VTSVRTPGVLCFMNNSDKIWRICLGLALILGAIGLYIVFAMSPDDHQQGSLVKIMYIHVPISWLSVMIWVVMSIASLISLVWRSQLADITAKAAAPLGASFTFLSIATGSIWGRPVWGTWWQWDARLTSVLILFIMYLGVMSLWNRIEDHTKAGRVIAIFTLVGALNIPIIKFSVYWWNTLHQPPSVLRVGGPTMDSSMLQPLLIMALSFTCLFLCLHVATMRNEILKRDLLALTAARDTRVDEA